MAVRVNTTLEMLDENRDKRGCWEGGSSWIIVVIITDKHHVGWTLKAKSTQYKNQRPFLSPDNTLVFFFPRTNHLWCLKMSNRISADSQQSTSCEPQVSPHVTFPQCNIIRATKVQRSSERCKDQLSYHLTRQPSWAFLIHLFTSKLGKE